MTVAYGGGLGGRAVDYIEYQLLDGDIDSALYDDRRLVPSGNLLQNVAERLMTLEIDNREGLMKTVGGCMRTHRSVVE